MFAATTSASACANTLAFAQKWPVPRGVEREKTFHFRRSWLLIISSDNAFALLVISN
jgi:hypothetical protein